MISISFPALKAAKIAFVAIVMSAASFARAADDIVFADFEGPDFGAWKTEDSAFGNGPAHGNVDTQGPVSGYVGKGLANSFHGGEQATGTLTSPEFKIERKYISFLIGGGWDKGTCVNLLIDGTVARSSSALRGNGEELTPASWEVSELASKTAHIELVDRSSGPWGHINVDQIVFTDRKPLALLINPSRELLAEKHWLYFPLKDAGTDNTAKNRIKITCDGKIVRTFMAEIAEKKPDWWSPLDISEWKGRKLTVQVDKMMENSPALQLIHQNDAWENADQLYREPMRPQFHFTARRGWTNDPNGLAYYNGEYHLFFQHDPFCRWGCATAHWGHAVSKDLVHWQELGEALYPDEKGGNWSGSGVVDWKNTSGLGKGGKPPLVLFYTHSCDPFVQCMAYSTDGRTFTKYAGNPVVENVSWANRDPKVFWYEPTQTWVMAFYAFFGRDPKTMKHTLQFFTSMNLREWKQVGAIEGGIGNDHFLSECPDIFPLAVDGDPKQTKWVLTAGNGEYKLGSFDGKKFTAETPKLPSRFGNAFYAAQTFNDEPQGRRIQIGWAVAFVPKMPFNQGMSVPLELTLRSTPDGPRMASWPAIEIDQLRRNSRTIPAQELKPGGNPLADVRADSFDLETAIEPGSAKKIVLDLRGTKVVYDTVTGTLVCGENCAPLPLVNGALRLRILADRMSLEMFGANGLVFMPVRFLSNPDNLSLKLTAEGGEAKIISLRIHDMTGIWPIEGKIIPRP